MAESSTRNRPRTAPPIDGRQFAVALFLSGLLAACGGSRIAVVDRQPVPDAFPHHSVEQIRDSVAAGTISLRGFSAKAAIAVSRQGESSRFSTEILHRRGDSLYMTASGALGVQGLRALLTPDSFFVYDRIKKKLFYGDISRAQELFLEPVYSDDLFRDLLGIPSISDGVDWRLESDSALYYLHDDAHGQMYMVDPGFWRVIRYSKRSPDGDLEEERTFSEFGIVDNVFLPRRITLRRPPRETAASIFFRSIDLDPPSYRFALDVGDDVEQVLVD
jgi:hypothetical protein